MTLISNLKICRLLMDNPDQIREITTDFKEDYHPWEIMHMITKDQDVLDATQIIASNQHPDRPAVNTDLMRLSSALQQERNPMASNYNPCAVQEFVTEFGVEAAGNAFEEIFEYIWQRRYDQKYIPEIEYF